MTKELRFSIGGGLACLLLLLAFVTGCTKIPNGGVPIYLLIDSATVAYDNGAFGSASCRIPDVWAESGSTNLGAYEMPARIPVLAQGSVPILVSAGIYDNGIVSTRASYPFYRPDTFTIPNAVAGQTYTYHPVYHYFANTQFALKEGFEGTNSFTNMTITNPGPDSSVYEGNHSGAIMMGATDSVITSIQSSQQTITTSGRQVYVEMNYKAGNNSDTTAFDVGMVATDANGYTNTQTLITIFPKPYWKKTYLNFSSFVGTYSGQKFQLYFIAYKNVGSTDAIYFDNVKILYFN